MKILSPLLAAPALAVLILAPLASASVYTGAWNNRTFDSTGALTIDFEIGAKNVTGSIDFDGPVFGGGDPPAIPLNATLKNDGSGKFLIPGTAMGDLEGNFKADGSLTIVITNIPGGFLTEVNIIGKFNLKLESFTATYQIDNAAGVFATGDAEAHVPQKPSVTAPRKVTYSGKKGSATIKVATNTGIKSVTAKSNHSAVKVSGKNPFKLTISKQQKKKTSVKVIVTNDDGFKTVRTITFIKSAK